MESPVIIRPRSLRHQKGGVRLRSGWWLIQYYETAPEHGIPVRKRVSKKLVQKNERYYSARCKALRDLQAEFMKKVNESGDKAAPTEVLITDFWENTYLPFLKENKRGSTVKGYEKIWELRLAPHFAGRTLRAYRTHQGTEFLNGLAKKLGRASISHVRSLASGLFSYAVNLALLESNPWREVKLLAKPKDSLPTSHYTLEEIENVIRALSDRVDAQLLFALAFYAGLRPSEIRGLKWDDLDVETGWVHVRRGVVGGEVGPLKTPDSAASIPLTNFVRGLLRVWRQKSGNPGEGWVFEGRTGKPLNLDKFAERVVFPVLEKRKLPWKGLYAARRGGATALTNLMGDPRAASQLLRHKNMGVTMTNYIKNDQRALVAGVKLLEAAAGNGNQS